MNQNPGKWEEPAPGVKVLKLWETDVKPGWPRIVILDLTAEQFQEFERDPLKFDKTHKLYPDQPILWMSHCARPPHAEGAGLPSESSGWTVVAIHSLNSAAVCAACPQQTVT